MGLNAGGIFLQNKICNGLDVKFVAKTLADRGMLERTADGFQRLRRIEGVPKRIYVVTAVIFGGAGELIATSAPTFR
jgi:hypothetical protein